MSDSVFLPKTLDMQTIFMRMLYDGSKTSFYNLNEKSCVLYAVIDYKLLKLSETSKQKNIFLGIPNICFLLGLWTLTEINLMMKTKWTTCLRIIPRHSDLLFINYKKILIEDPRDRCAGSAVTSVRI